MSIKKFVRLLADYCRHNQIATPEKILRGAPLIIDGTTIFLRHDAAIAPLLACAYCDLGLPAPDGQKEVMRRLLLANREIHFACGQSLMISPSTGHILLAQDIALERTDALALGQVLILMTHTAQSWKTSRFAMLFDAGPEPGDGAGRRRADSARRRISQLARSDVVA